MQTSRMRTMMSREHRQEGHDRRNKRDSTEAAPSMTTWLLPLLRRLVGMLPLLPLSLLLLVALSFAITPAAGGACPATTYSDGYVYTKDNGGFAIANPGWTVSGASFTTEVWLSSDSSGVTRCWWGQVGQGRDTRAAAQAGRRGAGRAGPTLRTRDQ